MTKQQIERVQTGVRIERRILGILKALADIHGMTLGDLIEGIALHAFEGKSAFSAETRQRIEQLKAAFGLDLGAADAHRFREPGGTAKRVGGRRARHGDD